MDKIRPHFWFDTEAVEAAGFYAETLPESRVTSVDRLSGTPSGDVDIVSFSVLGREFQAMSAGPTFTFNPSVSFLVRSADPAAIEGLWRTLSDGGATLMPLDSYPFSKRYGWLEDRYGLSWQLMLDEQTSGESLTPMQMFVGDVCGRAEEAINFYTSLFPDSRVGDIDRYESGEEPDAAGSVKFGQFQLAGESFAAIDSAHDHRFAFNEAVSFVVTCETQQEIDHYWQALSAVPEAEQCGWLKDRFGMSWQIVPSRIEELLFEGTADQIERVTAALLQMKKLDVAALLAARAGS